MKYKALILLIFTFTLSTLSAQRRPVVPKQLAIDLLPARVIDTVATSDPHTSLILYSNSTWRYHRPEFEKEMSALQVFNEYWDTAQIFSYRGVELSDLPETTDIQLISSLSDFHPPYVRKVLSKYGPRGRRNHNGVDLPLSTGEPIHSAFDGKVRYAKWNTGGYGYLVIVRHPNGLETWYAHLTRMNVRPNDYVKAGDILGFGGSTGRSSGPHLHFETRYCDQTFDPERLFDFENGNIKYLTFALERSFFNIRSRASEELEDHDWDEAILFAANEDGELTSDDILTRIEQGQAASRPQPKAETGEAVYHTIKSGDILGRLAIRYGVSIDQICRLNNISRTTTLRIGQRLRIK